MNKRLKITVRILLLAVVITTIMACNVLTACKEPIEHPVDTTVQTVPPDWETPTTPTEPTPTEPTEPTTQPTEPEPTEPSSNPTEPSVDPTEPTEQPPYDPDATDPEHHIHNYAPVESKGATCQNEGYAIYACTSCGATFESTLGIVPHDYVLTRETAATDTTKGTLTFTCSYCGHSYTVEVSS